MPAMRRREFLLSPAAATLRIGAGERLRLGLDSYSIRDLGWKATRLLEYAASLELDALQIAIPGELESQEPAYLHKLRNEAARSGIYLDTAAGCICPASAAYNPLAGDPVQYLLRCLRLSRELGAPVMRCFVGGPDDRRSGRPIEALIEATLKVLRSARQQALEMGVKVAIENHGEMQSQELKTLVEEAGRDWVGVCLDTGNPFHVLEDPLQTYEILGPFTLTTHVRDSVVWEHARGAAFQWVALGDGCLDLRALMQAHAQLCPRAPVQLEIITGRPPYILPYWEQEFWKFFPRVRAADFVRFVQLARRGYPFQGAMMIGGSGPQPPEFQAALRRQQQYDFERSVTYARTRLGLGLRERSRT
ncbi:MAG: sugar phosphate isomerase/epimerase [Bryobacterales bacterium]|nr:sugar phosphate isomerase/epimerase [Bryobacteraceae bacterium]MDW8131174.1 sugar phosphate isomerase/epimerase [Bryobacterales bacterium]